jgi:hypothetical protein
MTTIIPAQPGYFVLRLYKDYKNDEPFKWPIIAWAIDPTKGDLYNNVVKPITVCGMPSDQLDICEGVLQPDGSVIVSGDTYPSIADWAAEQRGYLTMLEERELKKTSSSQLEKNKAL